jgi:uncharacterized membrane protein YdjX (TVP38/TMEM64 family)
LLLFIILVVVVQIPFAIWGDILMSRFTLAGSVAWLEDYGHWAWLAGIIMLLADILLPIPGTLVMSALGYIYGPFLGGVLAATGSFASGAVGFWVCRSLGVKAAIKILGPKDFDKGKKTFENIGGWLVVLSRWLPVFPEVIACMAGLNRMSPGLFHLAILCSAIPMGFIYAAIGHAGLQHPTLAILLSVGLPALIWFMIRPIFKRMYS